MSEQRVERRLAAILAMDVAGYSRLMGVDEVGTLRALKAHRKHLIDPTISAYRGRIVKTTGDGMLVEFASVVDAVSCAAAVQRGMVARNIDIPQERRTEFRAGINIGDIIAEDTDIYGDGVNIAARLEGLAQPGGVCVSKTVRDQVRDKLPLRFDDLGEQAVQNIARPVRVFGLAAEAIAALPETAVAVPAPRSRRLTLRVAGAVAVALVVVAAGLSWYFTWTGPTVGERVATDDRPSIAILPFVNQSADKDQDYFSDGLTEDLVTELARIPRLVVMSRSATSKYKGQVVDIQQAGGELGVRYMVEGSVRRAGEQMRITIQLIEVATNAHVWAEHYDRPAKEIFAVQDEMTRGIATTLITSVSLQDLERAKRKPPNSLTVYELFLRGREQTRLVTPEANARAIELLEQAVAADPAYADALGALAHAYSAGFTLHWGPGKGRESLDRASEMAQRALALDPTSVSAARTLSLVYLFTRRFDDAIALLEQALEFDPSDDSVLLRLGDVHTYAGQPARGIELLLQALEINPRAFRAGHAFIGRGLLLLDRHEEAIAELKTCILRAPAFRPCHEIAAVAYAEMGRLDEARAAAMEAHRIDPIFTLASAPDVLPFENPQDLQRFLDGLRKAGLPEQ